MHYGDKEHIDSNILELIVYKHTSEFDEGGYYVSIESVYNCSHFSPRILARILVDFSKHFKKEAEEMDLEEWYLVKIKSYDIESFELVGYENVSITDDEFHRLH